LVRRLPFKRGFTNIFRIVYEEVNVDDLARVFSDGDTVTPEALVDAGLIHKATDPVVVLGRGEVPVKLTVKAHRFSKSAQAKIEGAGGSVEKLELPITGPFATVKKLRKEQIAEIRAQKSAD
jgi:large subunit ribosomal protein L15